MQILDPAYCCDVLKLPFYQLHRDKRNSHRISLMTIKVIHVADLHLDIEEIGESLCNLDALVNGLHKDLWREVRTENGLD